MPQKRIIIIGAGIAGLSAGCYARMNGYPTTIFERHVHPGGVCTTWERQGYRFDYCIHNLAGAGDRSATDLRPVWDALGALEGTPIIHHDQFLRVEAPDGQYLDVCNDLERLQRHWREVAPEDAALIDEHVRAARGMVDFDFMALGLGGPRRYASLVTHLPLVLKWGGVTLDALAARARNPFLRAALPHVQYDMPGIPVLPVLMFRAGTHRGDLGWPQGGSLAFSQRIAERFTALGGEIAYRSPVARILVEDDRAVGVRLADGSEHRADVIVAAGDGRTTIFDLLEGRYTTDLIRAYYDACPPNQPFGLTVYLGLNRDLSKEPHAISLLLDEPLVLEGEERRSLYLELFDAASGMAPAGKGVLKAVTVGTYSYWQALRAEPGRYKEEKAAVARAVVARLERRFPGITAQVEVQDVTTPLTVERFTGNTHGWQTWAAPKNAMRVMMGGLSKTLPGLQGFHMVGQWASASIGVSSAALGGRSLVQTLCRRDGRAFRDTPA